LPSEAEWEYACRGGTTTPFYCGETISTDLANYNGNYTYGRGQKGQYREKTTEVGIFPANPFGLYDMHGNVWEWCEDGCHENYINAPVDGTAWTSLSDNSKVLRGGSWLFNPGNCRSACRLYVDAGCGNDLAGFRVV
ncbi:MAG: formylglycine-generating enzyme family protein, partial [Dolichospermum sp.]